MENRNSSRQDDCDNLIDRYSIEYLSDCIRKNTTFEKVMLDDYTQDIIASATGDIASEGVSAGVAAAITGLATAGIAAGTMPAWAAAALGAGVGFGVGLITERVVGYLLEHPEDVEAAFEIIGRSEMIKAQGTLALWGIEPSPEMQLAFEAMTFGVTREQLKAFYNQSPMDPYEDNAYEAYLDFHEKYEGFEARDPFTHYGDDPYVLLDVGDSSTATPATPVPVQDKIAGSDEREAAIYPQEFPSMEWLVEQGLIVISDGQRAPTQDFVDWLIEHKYEPGGLVDLYGLSDPRLFDPLDPNMYRPIPPGIEFDIPSGIIPGLGIPGGFDKYPDGWPESAPLSMADQYGLPGATEGVEEAQPEIDEAVRRIAGESLDQKVAEEQVNMVAAGDETIMQTLLADFECYRVRLGI